MSEDNEIVTGAGEVLELEGSPIDVLRVPIVPFNYRMDGRENPTFLLMGSGLGNTITFTPITSRVIEGVKFPKHDNPTDVIQVIGLFNKAFGTMTFSTGPIRESYEGFKAVHAQTEKWGLVFYDVTATLLRVMGGNGREWCSIEFEKVLRTKDQTMELMDFLRAYQKEGSDITDLYEDLSEMVVKAGEDD